MNICEISEPNDVFYDKIKIFEVASAVFEHLSCSYDSRE